MDPLPPKTKWYYQIKSVVVALILFGPFAYPLLWRSERFNLFWKIALTVIFTALTIAMIVGSWELYVLLVREIRALTEVI